MKRGPCEFNFSHSGIHLLPLVQDQVKDRCRVTT